MSDPNKPTPPQRGRIFPVMPDPKPTPVVPPVIMTIPSDVSPTGAPILPPSISRWVASVVLVSGAIYVEQTRLLAAGVPPEVIKFATVIALVFGPTYGILSAGARKRRKT